MVSKFKIAFSKYINSKNERSKNILKNTIMSFGVKGGSILVGLLLVPMTISYINSVQYGIWLTLSSMISWMSFFDIGMGNGLRNKVAEAVAKGNTGDAKKYISTTYAILVCISVAIFVCFSVLNPLVDWKRLLNLPNLDENIHSIIQVVVSSFCIQFVVQLLNTVLIATHRPARASFITFVGQFGVLLSVFLMRFFFPGSLETLVWTLTFVPVLVFLIFSVFYYLGELKHLAPAVKDIDFRYSKDVLNVGGIFFFIQIGALVLFQTDNIIITKVLGPESVTDFNVAYKLFSVVIMIYTILITPYWSAFTDAYVKNDFDWIRKSISLMRKQWLILSVAAILLLFISKWVFALWLGDMVRISPILSVCMTIYVVVYMWQGLHVSFLNGIGKVKLQLYMVVISAVINIPLAIYWGQKYGLPGIISANTAVFIVMGIIFSLQVESILKKSKRHLRPIEVGT